MQTAFHTFQPSATFPQQEEAGTTRADINITVMILKSTTHHDIYPAESRHVDVRRHHFAVMIPADAMQADNQDVTIHLCQTDDNALLNEELVNTGMVFHRHLFAIAALPEPSLTVFHHLVIIPVTRTGSITAWNLLERITRQGIESTP